MTRTSIRAMFLAALLFAGTAMVPADSAPAFKTLGIGAMPACAQDGGDDDCDMWDDVVQCLDCLECLLRGGGWWCLLDCLECALPGCFPEQ